MVKSVSPCPLTQAALDTPNSLGFIDSTTALTFSNLNRQTDKIVLELQSMGIQSHSLIAVHLPPSHFLISLFFAAWRLGASVCPLNLRLPPSQIQTYLSQLSPQLFISHQLLNQYRGVCDCRFENVFTHLISPYKSCKIPIFQSLFLFTSGSTGTPKIAVLPLSCLIANAISAIAKFHLQPEDRWLLALPLYHVSGIGIMIRCILARAKIVLNERDPDITHLSWVPTQLYRSTPLYKKLKCLLLGGAAVNHFPSHLPCFVSYGLTEMGSVVAAGYKPSNLSCGSPLDGREISLAPNGEILVRGKCLFQGYWKENTLEKPFCSEGWFKTGDIGNYCPQNGLKILGRKDRQFISGGENIQPEEIEHALLELNYVLEAVVIPIHDPEFGARPVAFIKSSNPQLNHKLIQQTLLEKLPKYKLPKSLILVDEMPRKGLKTDRDQLLNLLRNSTN